jgi:hypothetical protein
MAMRKCRALLTVLLCTCMRLCAGQMTVHLSWGHTASRTSPYYVRLAPASEGISVGSVNVEGLESGEGLQNGAWQSNAGAGDVDGIRFEVIYPDQPPTQLQNLHIIWADLIANSDTDTARRLSEDTALHPNASKLTVFTSAGEDAGFTVSTDQLLQHNAIWIPSLDMYISVGENPVSFDEHIRHLSAWKGQRTLDRVHSEPEATYELYESRWKDMGSPFYVHPQEPEPGHIVGLTWDSAIAKFGVDRASGIRNDYGNPDHFQFWFDFGSLSHGVLDSWKGQRLADGLPVLTTVLEKAGARFEVEQFAYPLDGPTSERLGEIPMVLMQKVKVTDLLGTDRTIPITLNERRSFSPYADSSFLAEQSQNCTLFRESAHHQVLLAIQGLEGVPAWAGIRDYQERDSQNQQKRLDVTVFVDLQRNSSREFVVKLPSPMIPPEKAGTFAAIDYDTARAATIKFWSDYIDRGARFQVPEKAVNDLFRASLWHALRLPRRHDENGGDVRIDLPYSNFAYSQTGTPWPINQAVYVDYMIYALRGYDAIATEELEAQYRNNQEYSGRVNGYANWLAYTPGMLYAVAQTYLLTHNRQALDRSMPQTGKALDWCLNELQRAGNTSGGTKGLLAGPLNDGTGQGVWAFNQAYFYGGLERFGHALQEIGDPRAQKVLEYASALPEAARHAFGSASARSTLVQLRDHTWIPYVPSEALTYRRLLDQWYPADIDTGAVHMIRLQLLPASGLLADSLLNDHEDNLFLKGWGIANEPVYNQQATAYLLRDDPKAVINAFYSYMASAFSHTVFEPVEHRWTWGQYFGPPSTDGAWFELYRNMLVREADDQTLFLGQATPRKWLEDGKRILVENAPTYFGPVSFQIESHVGSGTINANVTLRSNPRLHTLLVRLRHPESKQIRSVSVNGASWTDIDKQRELIRITAPREGTYSIQATY